MIGRQRQDGSFLEKPTPQRPDNDFPRQPPELEQTATGGGGASRSTSGTAGGGGSTAVEKFDPHRSRGAAPPPAHPVAGHPWSPHTPSPHGPPPPPGMWGMGFPGGPPPPGMQGHWPPGHPGMGPIPMGYQLAKDPLTGQILLIPTDGSPSGAGQGSAWPPPTPQPYDAASSLSSYGRSALGPPPPSHHPPVSASGAAAQAHYHHMYLQQHQLQHHYYQQQHAAAHQQQQQQLQMAAAAKRSLEPPETITVSDDDEEIKDKKKPLGKNTSSAIAAEAAAASAPPTTATAEARTATATPPPSLRNAESTRSPPSGVPETLGQVKKEMSAPTKEEEKDPDAVFDSLLEQPSEATKSPAAEHNTTPCLSKVKLEPETQETPLNETAEAATVSSPVTNQPEVPDPAAAADDAEEKDEDTNNETEDMADEAEKSEENDEENLPKKEDGIGALLPVKTEPEEEVDIGEAPSTTPSPAAASISPPNNNNKNKNVVPETLLPAYSLANLSNESEAAVAEDLLAFSQSPVEFNAGLDMLCKGIDLLPPPFHLADPHGMGLLYSVTAADSVNYGIHLKGLDESKLSVEVLCTVTQLDYYYEMTRVDPMVALRKKYNLHDFQSPATEKASKEYISNKVKQFTKEAMEGAEFDNYRDIKSLAAQIKTIKNMDIMSQKEIEIREQIAKLHQLYKDLKGVATKLKTTPKKKRLGNSKRGPGRPKKRKLTRTLSNAKMGRPRKTKLPQILEEPEEGQQQQQQQQLQEVEEGEGDDEEEEVGEEEDVEDMSPPVLEPIEPPPSLTPNIDGNDQSSTSQETSAGAPKGLCAAGLLKPPKLTASLSPPASSSSTTAVTKNSAGCVTNLSTISAKFMKGKINPFANLMKLASVPSSGNGSKDNSRANSSDEDSGENEDEDEEDEEKKSEAAVKEELVEEEDAEMEEEHEQEEEEEEEEPEKEEEEEEEEEEEGEEESSSEDSGNFETPKKSKMAVPRTPSPQPAPTPPPPPPPTQSTDPEPSGAAMNDGSSSKKRKSEKPRKHMGSTETIVPKKPKNIFMMDHTNLQRTFKSTSAAAAAKAAANASVPTGDEYDFHEEDDDHIVIPPPKLQSQTTSSSSSSAAVSAATPTSSRPRIFATDYSREIAKGFSSKPTAGKKAATNAPWTTNPNSSAPTSAGTSRMTTPSRVSA